MTQTQKTAVPESPARILIVDDEPHLRDSLADLLAAQQHDVHKAQDGADALRILDRESFDLILLDLMMPRLTGHQVLERLQQKPIATKIIVVSGDSAVESAIGALRCGAYDFIRKPYEPDEMLKRVENALASHRLEQANKEMERRLKRSEQLHRYLINSSLDLIYTLDHAGRFTFVNDAASTMLGYSKQELIGKHYSTIIHMEDLAKAENLFNERRTGKRSTRGMEIRLKHNKRGLPLGTTHPFIVTEFSAMGMYDTGDREQSRFMGTYGVVRDITDRKKIEEAIAFQAYHDLLTGLPNRLLLLDRIAQAISQAKRGNSQVAVMFLDLDNFKFVNDSLGHFAGDKLLQAIASRLKSCLRGVDTSARLGGDEFVLLLPQINGEADAAMIAEKILSVFQEKFVIGEHEVFASLSIGIGLFPNDGETAETLIKNADAAMYHAKNMGRNNYKFYRHMIEVPSSGMEVPSSGRLSEVHDLRLAIERDEFDIYYHPQVEIASGRIIGLEALLRWNHPQRGLLTPSSFFRTAEESGLICPIGDWVLTRVCSDMAAWHANGVQTGRVAINLSAQQIEKERSDELFLRLLDQNNIAPHTIGIEITESIVMKDLDRTIHKLKGLREAGIEISLDDFGTGYSSLGYLQRLPIHVIKVDQCFVQDVAQHPGHVSILSAITTMAEGLQLRLMVEGVETEGQLELLSSLGCKEYQGFLFSRPLAREEITKILSANGSGKRPVAQLKPSSLVS